MFKFISKNTLAVTAGISGVLTFSFEMAEDSINFLIMGGVSQIVYLIAVGIGFLRYYHSDSE